MNTVYKSYLIKLLQVNNGIKRLILSVRIYWLLPILLLMSSFPAVGDDVSVFGPAQFTRRSGSPVTESQTVTVTNPAASYRLIVVNGGNPEGTKTGGSVSSGTIYWNGKQVAGPSQFKKNSILLSIPVEALLINALSVELQGKPGSSITVQLVRGNQPPVAQAGFDQTLAVGELAKLDASDSTDADGDSLSYRWRLQEAPANSFAQLSDSSAIRPDFLIDRFGRYQAELVVSDGFADSAPDLAIIDTRNSAPIANAGEDQSAFVGASVLLDGGLSKDNDSDPLSYQWHLDEKPASSSAVLIDDRQQIARIVIDKPGHYVARLIVNDGQLDSGPDLIAIDTLNSAPVADAGEDQTVDAGTSVRLDGNLSHDIDGDAIDYVWSLLAKPDGSETDLQEADSITPLLTPDVPGLYVSQLKVTDPDQASSTDTQVVTALAPPVNHSPVIDSEPVTSVVAGQSYRYSVHATDPDGDTLTYHLTGAPEGMAISAAGVIDWLPPASGNYPVIVSVIDGRGGDTSQSFIVAVSETQDSNLPPDPVKIAPKPDPTRIETLAERNTFLYSGDHPIQADVDPKTIEARRIAIVRGTVFDSENRPLPGVRITIKDHPEFGHTLTRSDGIFDLAVNGGGPLTLDYSKEGYLPLQRTVSTPWQDYVHADDVVMIPLDANVNVIDLNNTTEPYQVAQGSLEADSDGQRQATVLFPQGTAASMVLPDGSSQDLTSLTVRATEYTVGENGPKRMPGLLPPTSGYTYAVELSVDEAMAQGAVQVNFSKPLPVYVDNFLNFPVGEVVPSGWYDRSKAAWIPSDNGRVVAILAVENGSAKLDIDGDNLDDTGSKLEALGITEDEQRQLAKLYSAGKSLWRVPVTHFTPWDFNWPFGPPLGAIYPPVQDKSQESPPDQYCNNCPGSQINPQARTVGEAVAIAGTPYALHYQSRRSPGYQPTRTLDIPITGADVPASIGSIDLSVDIAGRRFSQSFNASPNQVYRFVWNGLDAYNREVVGSAPATVTLVYRYQAVYYSIRSDFQRSFGQSGTTARGMSVNRRAGTIAFSRTWQKMLSGNQPDAGSLGGWSLSHHHNYDISARVLELGNGERIAADNQGLTIKRVAGGGGDSREGVPAVTAWLRSASGIDIAADGSIFITEGENNYQVRKVNPDGLIYTVAGNGVPGFGGDGGPATQAYVSQPKDVAVAPDGSFYIADSSNNRIRKVDRNGIISTVAGNESKGYAGDGGPAVQAQLFSPSGLALAPDGSLYIADSANNRIRKLDGNGIISTVAGSGSAGYGGDGGMAIQAKLSNPTKIALGPDGSLYIADSNNQRIRKVGNDGVITTVAGIGQAGYEGDGGPAILAKLNSPAALTVGADGSLYIADRSNFRIRKVGPDNVITTIAGNGQRGSSGDGGPTVQAQLYNPSDIALGPDGALFIANIRTYPYDPLNNNIRKLTSPFPGLGLGDLFIPSADASQVYHFDPHGKHLRTLDAVTRAVLLRFGYDAEGRLSTITDIDNDVTRIERGAEGIVMAIVAPDGQRTELTVNPDGTLGAITGPDGHRYEMTYLPKGLLESFSNPNRHASTFSYDSQGRLEKDMDAAGGGWTVDGSTRSTGYTSIMSTGENRVHRFAVDYLSTGERLQVNTAADGTVQNRLFNPQDYLETATSADGTVATGQQGPDPRFGMQAPLQISSTVKTPSGLTATVTQKRTVSLTDSDDPLSLTALSDTVSVNGNTSTLSYNAQTKTWTATSAENRTSSVQINGQGRPLLSALGDIEPVAYEYDERGMLSAVSQGQGEAQRKTAYRYYDHTDATSGALKGYLESSTDALGRSEHFAYDAAGRILSQILSDNRVIQYQYDANGNLTGIRPPERGDHLFNHNAVDLVERYTPPDAPGIAQTYTQYLYNKDKQPTRIQRPDGQTIDFIYQPQSGKLDALHTPDGDIHYQYLPASGQLDSITSPDGGSLSYRYDGGLVTGQSWDGSINGQVDFGYNSDFRVKSISLNQADSVAYSYDKDGLLTQAGELSLSRKAQNGLLSGTVLGAVSDSVSYNGFGETSDYQATVNGISLLRWVYQRDKLGRISQKTESRGGISHSLDYRYDDSGRLEQVTDNGATVASYGYDANGNRTQLNGQTVAVYDSQDRLIDFNGKHYAYTDNGELQSKTENEQTTSYGYDVFGNLRHVDLPDGTRIDYVIDGQNRRIGKKVNGQLVQAWLYQSQLNPIAELDGNGQVVTRFVYGDKGNVPSYLVKTDPVTQAKTTYRLVSDHLGSPRFVVDTATGSVVQELDYDAWGHLIRDSNPGFQPFGFAGGLYDPHTKLVRFGARDYDAETGRWTAKDPIGFAGGLNTYAYVTNSPLNLIDPLGLDGASAAQWALSQVGKPGYGYFDPSPESHGKIQDLLDNFGMRGIRSPKCNKFAWDALANGGDPAGRMPDGRIPSASEWANPKIYIPGYYILPSDSSLKPGDVISDGHHMGLYVPLDSGNPGTVSAAYPFTGGTGINGGVVNNDWGFRDGQNPVVRRCECDK
jgi:RHS repeat-associated protein